MSRQPHLYPPRHEMTATLPMLFGALIMWLGIKFGARQPAWAKRLEVQQNLILEELMKTQADLDAGIATLQQDDVLVLQAVSTTGTTISAALKDLLDKIASNPGAPVSDFQAEVDNLAQLHGDFSGAISSLGELAAKAAGADPGPQGDAAAASTLSISASPTAPDTTSPITFAGSVQGGAKVPTGSVSISGSTDALSTSATLDSNGGFSATPVGPLAAGSYSVTAIYGGDASNTASNATLSITVTDAAPAQ